MERTFVRGTWQQRRSFSPAVVTSGPGQRVVWLAGHGAPQTPEGRSLAGDFDAQARQSFANLRETLRGCGADLADIVQMTVFIADPRHGDRFVEIRREHFPGGDYPGSALVTVAGFAQPGMMVEIQAVAVT